MSISEKQLTANRQNAQLCTGPTTPEGKARSSQNARRHGVTAQTTVMTDEDRVKHDEFCLNMIRELNPEGELEIFHASSAAEEAWRLHYSRAQCNNIIAIGHFDGTGDIYETDHAEIHTAITAATVARDRAKTLELLSLYEQRIHNSFQKHCAQLRKLQADREARYQKDLDEARLFSQLAVIKHLPYHPSKDGFVFSNDEVKKYTERYNRLKLAREGDVAYRKHADLWELPTAA